MILGLHGALEGEPPTYCHNAGYCLLDPRDGVVVRLVEWDKASGEKNTGGLDRERLLADLEHYGTGGMELAVSHFSPLAERPSPGFMPLWTGFPDALGREVGILDSFTTTALGRPLAAYVYLHELAHVFCAYSFRRRDVGEFLGLVNEGCGSFSQSALFHFADRRIRLVDHHLPILSGHCFHQWLAEVILDIPRTDRHSRKAAPGKLMALAAFGDPERFGPVVRQAAAGIPRHRYFNYRTEFLPSLRGRFMTWQEKIDLCAATQKVFEESLLAELVRIRRQFGDLPLFYAGGCALSIKANTEIRNCFSDVTIPPNCGDDGQMLGLAGAHLFCRFGRLIAPLDHARGLSSALPDLPLGQARADEVTLRRAVEWLRQGEVLACAEGHPEIGPRALGRRSLLAAPTHPHAREVLNYVKRREYYRPVAPAVLDQDGPKYFEKYFFSPYMLYDFRVKPEYRGVLSQCTHEDGSARVQSVADDGSTLARLLKRFREVSGIGVLLNTSLNQRGHPIPWDEAAVFREVCGLEVGGLLLGGRLLRRDVEGRFRPMTDEDCCRGRSRATPARHNAD